MKLMANLKKTVSVLFLFAGIMVLSACKDYLNVTPKDKLTGNNFYLSEDDVIANMTSMYSAFFDKINESHVIGAIGEYRSGEVFASPGAVNEASRRVVEVLGRNDLLSAIDPGAAWNWYNLGRVTNWTRYYQVIQSANILIDKLEEGIPGLDEGATQRYIAEATFLRCFTYFWMVRLYGDVVYYTTPYQADPLPREDMVSVMNKCIADMQSRKDALPWTYSDPALRGARASRGSALALLMHMNMWNAGFDPMNKAQYYQATTGFGEELVAGNAYRLLPMDEEGWGAVMKGRSEESLFEFYRSINYGDDNSLLSPFGDHFLRWPYKFPRHNAELSLCYFNSFYMQRLYPEEVADKRRTFWYENMLADDGTFVILKYAFNVYASGNESENPDNTFLIFRYAGALLLQAEALAELGRDAEAIEMLNLVRSRAEATQYNGPGGQHLKDFIFMERARELLGEGHRYFDLVRTGRIMSSTWARFPLNRDQFDRGAWTWPIDAGARNNNPYMTLNQYWVSGGR